MQVWRLFSYWANRINRLHDICIIFSMDLSKTRNAKHPGLGEGDLLRGLRECLQEHAEQSLSGGKCFSSITTCPKATDTNPDREFEELEKNPQKHDFMFCVGRDPKRLFSPTSPVTVKDSFPQIRFLKALSSLTLNTTRIQGPSHIQPLIHQLPQVILGRAVFHLLVSQCILIHQKLFLFNESLAYRIDFCPC